MLFGAALAYGAVLSSAVFPQDAGRAGVVNASQISSQASPTGMAQIQRTAPSAIGEPQAVDRGLPSPPPSDDPEPATHLQLTSGPRRADVGRQLAPGDPSAGPSAPAAARMAGRNTGVERPEGPDRCDPRRESEAAVCARVIETRAGDFPAPNPEPLSPEQRLLVAQRDMSDQNRAVADQTRRLGAGRIDEDNVALAVASLRSTPSRPAEEEEPAAENAVADAIVAAVVSLVGGPTP